MTNDPGMVKHLFGEMIALGIEPSLTTFRLVLGSSAVPKAEEAVNYLHQVLTKLEGRDEIVVVQRTDFEFYLVAMEIALKANCLSLGERIEALYRSQKNKVALPGLVDGDECVSSLFPFANNHSIGHQPMMHFLKLLNTNNLPVYFRLCFSAFSPTIFAF
jgi:hypothetical protein